MSAISGYHAHVYFDADTRSAAEELCTKTATLFPAQMGRVHARNVGPHPRWSCQLAFDPEAFSEIIPWLMLNRGGLTIFVHPETGDHLADHRDHALWMGERLALNLEMFQ